MRWNRSWIRVAPGAAILILAWPLAAAATPDQAASGAGSPAEIVLNHEQDGHGEMPTVCVQDSCKDLSDLLNEVGPGVDGDRSAAGDVGPGDEHPGPGDDLGLGDDLGMGDHDHGGDVLGDDGPPPRDGGDFPSVPEPGTLMLLGAGLGGLALAGRRRS